MKQQLPPKDITCLACKNTIKKYHMHHHVFNGFYGSPDHKYIGSLHMKCQVKKNARLSQYYCFASECVKYCRRQ